MDFILKVLRWFEVISFCLANLFVGIFFWKFLFNASIIPFLIAGGVSICVLKIQWLFLVADRNREKEVSSASTDWGAVTKVKKIVTGQHPPSPILTECQSSTPFFLKQPHTTVRSLYYER
jgi:hypothetical protein